LVVCFLFCGCFQEMAVSNLVALSWEFAKQRVLWTKTHYSHLFTMALWTMADYRGVALFKLLISVAIWQWLRMIQLLNPVVGQPLYPATFCKATEQCTTVSKVAFTRELYPKASCGCCGERMSPCLGSDRLYRSCHGAWLPAELRCAAVTCCHSHKIHKTLQSLH